MRGVDRLPARARYGGEVSGRGAGQQRGQEAAALHDDGGEVQHEVGEAVQPALLYIGSGGAHLVWDRNLQKKNNSTALLMKNFCER